MTLARPCGMLATWQNIYICVNNHKTIYFSLFIYDNHLSLWNDIFSDCLFQNSQCICSTSNFNPDFISFHHKWIFLSKITYYDQIFMLTRLLNYNLMQTMWFWVLFHLSTCHCFRLLYISCGLGASFIIQ